MSSSSWLKSGTYSLLGYGAQMGLGFAAFLVLIRLMPEREFGVWALFLTLTAFAEMGRMGLTQNATIKFCVEEKESAGAVISAGFVLNTLATLIISATLLLLSIPLRDLWSAPELTGLLWWYLPFALVEGSARFIDFVHISHNDFRGVFWSKLTYGAVLLAAILLLWQRSGGVDIHYLPILQLVAAVPSLLVNILHEPWRLRRGPLEWAWVKRIFHFGKYVLGTNFSSMFFNKTDIMMVGYFLSPTAVAMYNVATRITNYMEVPMTSIAQAVYPHIASANQHTGPAAVARLYEWSVGLLLATLLPLAVFVLLLSRPLVVLLAGEPYAGAAPLLNILVIGMLAKPWGRLFGITLDAIGRPRLNFALLFTSLFANVALNILLIPRYGIEGAAMASLISMWAMILAGQVIISRILPVRQAAVWKAVWAFYRRPRAALRFRDEG